MHEIWTCPVSKVRNIFYLNLGVMIFSLLASYLLTLLHRGVRYHEPEHWKFGESGNKYFRHATGQLYAISNDLATYISTNQ